MLGTSQGRGARGEERRAARDRCYTTIARDARYPLIEWGWTRATSSAFLRETYGEPWSRSACSYCPFQASRTGSAGLLRRWQAEPGKAADALLLEHTATVLNPRSTLFGATSAWRFATRHRLTAVTDAATQAIAGAEHALYEVRRIYHARGGDPAAKGPAWRSVRRLAVGSRAEMTGLLRQRAAAARLPLHLDTRNIPRVWLRRPGPPYPTVEHMWTVGPATVADKERPGFTARWTALVDQVQLPLFTA